MLVPFGPPQSSSLTNSMAGHVPRSVRFGVSHPRPGKKTPKIIGLLPPLLPPRLPPMARAGQSRAGGIWTSRAPYKRQVNPYCTRSGSSRTQLRAVKRSRVSFLRRVVNGRRVGKLRPLLTPAGKLRPQRTPGVARRSRESPRGDASVRSDDQLQEVFEVFFYRHTRQKKWKWSGRMGGGREGARLEARPCAPPPPTHPVRPSRPHFGDPLLCVRKSPHSITRRGILTIASAPDRAKGRGGIFHS